MVIISINKEVQIVNSFGRSDHGLFALVTKSFTTDSGPTIRGPGLKLEKYFKSPAETSLKRKNAIKISSFCIIAILYFYF